LFWAAIKFRVFPDFSSQVTLSAALITAFDPLERARWCFPNLRFYYITNQVHCVQIFPQQFINIGTLMKFPVLRTKRFIAVIAISAYESVPIELNLVHISQIISNRWPFKYYFPIYVLVF
jgi:hypothetical protein